MKYHDDTEVKSNLLKMEVRKLDQTFTKHRSIMMIGELKRQIIQKTNEFSTW